MNDIHMRDVALIVLPNVELRDSRPSNTTGQYAHSPQLANGCLSDCELTISTDMTSSCTHIHKVVPDQSSFSGDEPTRNTVGGASRVGRCWNSAEHTVMTKMWEEANAKPCKPDHHVHTCYTDASKETVRQREPCREMVRTA